MATEIFTTEVVKLLDGTEVELRPLSLSRLRKFVKIWTDYMNVGSEKFKKAESEDNIEGLLNDYDMKTLEYDSFVKMCALGLETQLKTAEMTEKKFIEYLEDVLDENTIYKMLEVFGNLKLGGAGQDENLTQAAAGLLGTN